MQVEEEAWQGSETSYLRAEGSLVVSDLGKPVFPEDYPGSGVSGGQARKQMMGGHFCSSSCLIQGDDNGSGSSAGSR